MISFRRRENSVDTSQRTDIFNDIVVPSFQGTVQLLSEGFRQDRGRSREDYTITYRKVKRMKHIDQNGTCFNEEPVRTRATVLFLLYLSTCSEV
jgi:hypothetical protein